MVSWDILLVSIPLTKLMAHPFSPGLSTDFTGRPVVTGGNNAPKASIYNPVTNAWIAAPNMQIPRGYQASCTLSDGRTFTIGGSWSGWSYLPTES